MLVASASSDKVEEQLDDSDKAGVDGSDGPELAQRGVLALVEGADGVDGGGGNAVETAEGRGASVCLLPLFSRRPRTLSRRSHSSSAWFALFEPHPEVVLASEE